MRALFIFYAINIFFKAGPIAERSKSSDGGRGDPGSNPGGGSFFLLSFRMVN